MVVRLRGIQDSSEFLDTLTIGEVFVLMSNLQIHTREAYEGGRRRGDCKLQETRLVAIAHPLPANQHLFLGTIDTHSTSRRYHGRFSHDHTFSASDITCIFELAWLSGPSFLCVVICTLITVYNTSHTLCPFLF